MTPDELRSAIAASEEIVGGSKRRLLGLPDGHLSLLEEEWSLPGATSATVMAAFCRGAISFDAVKDMRRVLQGKAVPTQTGPRKAPPCGGDRRNGRVEGRAGVEFMAEFALGGACVPAAEPLERSARTLNATVSRHIRNATPSTFSLARKR
jgi:hypothetical protein